MKKVLFSTISLAVLSVLLFNINTYLVSADFWEGLDYSAGNMGYSVLSDKQKNPLYSQIGQILNISTTFLGVVFLGLMIYSGYLWMLARGNEQEVEKAKNIIIYAVIGLVVVLSAYAITRSIYWFFYAEKYY